MNIYDITIIGAGPAGLFAGTYGLMRNAKLQIIDSLSQVGGQVSTLFPNKKIYDVPGFYGITGEELTQKLYKQLLNFSPEIHLNETVISFRKNDDNVFEIKTNTRITMSKTIIIAAGMGAFEPKKLPLDNAKLLENKSIFYHVQNPTKYQNKIIAITGGGDSAIDWTLELSKYAQKIFLIHRRNQFRALESNLELVKSLPNVEILTPYSINNVEQNEKLKISLLKSRTQDFHTIDVDNLLVNYGFMSDKSVLKNWNLQNEHGKISVKFNQETSLEGIYAIGDIATYDGKTALIATGMGEAPLAINAALNHIYPKARQPIHSTRLMSKINKN